MLDTPTLDAQHFADSFGGEIIRPGDSGYDDAARTALCTGAPALVLRPRDTADVQRAVRFAAASGVPLAVRGGGHSAAGFGTVDDGIVIDLGALDDVALVGERRVRVGGGAVWRQVADVLTPRGLAISSGDTADVGVGGLTLSGGIGWMVRRDGLTLDRLRAAEVVTATGDVITASAHEHAELFWALRGGGGAYGIVTAFEFEAQPTGEVTLARLTFPAAEAAHVVPAWARILQTAPDGVSSMLMLANPQAGGRDAPIEVAMVVSAGDANEAIAAVRALGTVLSEDIRRCDYPDTLHEGVELPGFLRAAVRNGFVGAERADAAAATVAELAAEEQPAAIILHALGGAFGRVATDATAFAHRSAVLMVTTFGVAPAPAIDAARARIDELWESLEPFLDGAYASSLDGTSARAVEAVYPASTRARLSAVKAQYDPAGLLSRNFAPRTPVAS